MEYLDTYDENMHFTGKYPRDYVHENALWHNTVHCWLYDNEGNIYFQIRKDENKLYTTASGHVMAGESVKEAFGREIKEEIGIDVDYDKASLVNIYIFKMDKTKSDGSVFRDRAFSNVYISEFDNDYSKFHFDTSEINGLVKVNAKEAIELFKKEKGNINAQIILSNNDNITIEEKTIDFSDFLVNKNETAIGKYGDILRKVIECTNIS